MDRAGVSCGPAPVRARCAGSSAGAAARLDVFGGYAAATDKEKGPSPQ